MTACGDGGGCPEQWSQPGPPSSAGWGRRLGSVDGHLVTVRTYGDDGPALNPVAFLDGMTAVDRETFLDRRFIDR